ncbi:hypothetical protein BKA80DRAFT_260215 [Phyllosticta citrichinensis]
MRVVAAQVKILLCSSRVSSGCLLVLLYVLLLHCLSLGLLGGVLVGGLGRSSFLAVALISMCLSLSLSVSGVGLSMLDVLGFLLPQILGLLSPRHSLKASLCGRGKRRRKVVVWRRVAILLAGWAWGRETELRASRWSRGRRVAHVAGGRMGGAARGALDATWASRRVASGRLVCLGRRRLAQVMLLHECIMALRFGLRLHCSCLGNRLYLDLALPSKLILAPLLLHQRPIPATNTIIRPLIGTSVR